MTVPGSSDLLLIPSLKGLAPFPSSIDPFVIIDEALTCSKT